MKTQRLTLFDVELRSSKFYKVIVDVSDTHFEVIDYQLRKNGDRRIAFKPRIDEIDEKLLQLKALEKLQLLHECGII